MADSQGVTVSNISPADLIQDDRARAEALRQFMTGATTYGSPTREEQIGLTSRPPELEMFRPAEPTLEEQIEAGQQALSDLTSPSEGPAPDATATELAEWKKKFGDRENEFGAQRRKIQELEETLTLLLAQRQTAAPPAFAPQTPQSPPQFNPWQNRPQAPQPLFGGKSEEELPSVGEVKEVINDLGQALGFTWQQLQGLQAENLALKQATIAQTKAAAGISQLDELRLQAKYPYLQGLAEDGNKIGLMKTLLEVERSKDAPAPATPSQIQDTTNRVVRRLTHTENNRGSSGPAEQPANVVFAQEMEKIKQLPFHLRSAAMEKLMKQAGVSPVRALGTGGFRR